MFVSLKRMLTIPFFLLAFGSSVLACMNDMYTVDSETLWGARYDNALEVNNITFVILLAITYLLLARIYFRQKHESYSQDHVFTIFMGILVSTLVFMRIYAGEFMAWLFLAIFAIFYVIRLLGQIVWIVWHMKTAKKGEEAFAVLTVWSFPILWYILRSWNMDNPFWALGFIIITNTILIYSYLCIEHYRYKVYSAMALVLFFLFSAPASYRVYDFFLYSYFQ